MEAFTTKQEEKLFRALQTLLSNSVDSIGLPKKATVKQLHRANKALTDYENYEQNYRAKAKQNGA
jgi:hypothetical protein